MQDDDGYFGEPVAATYDETSEEMFAPEVVNPTVDFLAELAGTGRALELGIGTGRIALPLAARGVPVHGRTCEICPVISTEPTGRLELPTGGLRNRCSTG